MHLGKWQAALGAGTIALSGILTAVTPAAAGTAPLRISADRPGAVPAGHNWGYNDFFPRTLSVPRGTTIQFVDKGFHTFSLLPHGLTINADMHASGIGQPDADDTTRNPNGTSHTQLFVPGLAPSPAGCGSAATPCEFNGSQVVSQGNPLGLPGAAPGPVNIKLTAAPGFYAFHCRVHPGMSGHLHILRASASAPSKAHVLQRVRRQVHKDKVDALAVEASARATRTQGAHGHSVWHMWAGAVSTNGRVAILEFLPRNLHVRRGDRVVWTVPGAAEVHTVTFPGELFTDLLPLCENGDGTDSPAIPNHVPPQGPGDFHCGTSAPLDEIEFGGGNGHHVVRSHTTVVDSGVLIPHLSQLAFGVPRSASRGTFSVRFKAAPGRYHYLCQIHAGMEANIVVRAP
jgi:plastocyanin